TRTVFAFDAAASTVLASRNIAGLSPTLAVSSDGSRFLSGPLVFETSTMLVLAQQNTTNSPYVMPGITFNNFNTQTTQGGAVFIVLPLGMLRNQPIALPDSNVALLATDQCGVTAALNSAIIPVRDVGGGRITVAAQAVTTTATTATVRATARPYGGDVTASINGGAARTLGTAAADQVLIQATEAV